MPGVQITADFAGNQPAATLPAPGRPAGETEQEWIAGSGQPQNAAVPSSWRGCLAALGIAPATGFVPGNEKMATPPAQPGLRAQDSTEAAVRASKSAGTQAMSPAKQIPGSTRHAKMRDGTASTRESSPLAKPPKPEQGKTTPIGVRPGDGPGNEAALPAMPDLMVPHDMQPVSGRGKKQTEENSGVIRRLDFAAEASDAQLGWKSATERERPNYKTEGIKADGNTQESRAGFENRTETAASFRSQAGREGRVPVAGLPTANAGEPLNGCVPTRALSHSSDARTDSAKVEPAGMDSAREQKQPDMSKQGLSEPKKAGMFTPAQQSISANTRPHKTANESSGRAKFPVNAVQDASGAAPVGDVLGVPLLDGKRGAGNEAVHVPASGMSNITGEQTFAALDREAQPGPVQWVHAGARHAEAGYLDSALGWVGVRAEASPGGIHAAVLPGSFAAAQVLSGHMSGLSAFLAEHHGGSSTITLASPGNEGRATATAQENSAGQGGGRDHGRDASGAGGLETEAPQPGTSRTADPPGGGAASGSGIRVSGTHISVMA